MPCSSRAANSSHRSLPAHFSGASVGGSFLKVGSIGIGLRMEILVDGRRIVTSPVRDISTAGSGSSRVH